MGVFVFYYLFSKNGCFKGHHLLTLKLEKSMATVKCLVTKNCVQLKKEMYTGLEQVEGE